MINLHSTGGGAAEPKPRITVIGVGGAGGNAVNNMIQSHLEGVEFIVANTDAQALAQSRTDRRIQLGNAVTQGLGAGARPEVGRAAAEEALEQVIGEIAGSNMVFITAGMGGGTGTGAAPVIARAAREHGILTVGVVTKPFHFEGAHRMRLAESGIEELAQYADTLIIIPNQNLFRVATAKTTFADAFKMADDVLHSGVRGVTDLMVVPGLINLDFADIRSVMSEMGKAMMGTGQAEGEGRALAAAEAAINNPLIEDISMKGARSVLINVTGGLDMTLFEADEAATRISSEVDPDANIIFGATFDEKLEGRIRISIVATGIEAAQTLPRPNTVTVLNTRKRSGTPSSSGGGETQSRPAITAHAAEQALAVIEPMLNLSTSAAPEAPARTEYEAPAATQLPAVPAVAYAPSVPVSAQPAVQAQLPVAVPARMAEVAPPARMEVSRPFEAPTRPYDGRREPRLDPVAQAAQAVAAQPQASEPVRRGGLFSRLTGHVLGSSAPVPPQAPAPQPQRPAEMAQPAARPAPAVPQARLSPADRLPASRGNNSEEVLDIPAFLRRQAN